MCIKKLHASFCIGKSEIPSFCIFICALNEEKIMRLLFLLCRHLRCYTEDDKA